METETQTEEAAADGGDGENPMAGMDPEMAANPQPIFKALRADMPIMSIDMPSGAKGVLLTKKEDIMSALRQPDVFSSNMDAVDLKNKRPMIPLQIDPPDHKKFRKLLDPIFAPRKMAAMDEEVSALVNHLIDQFIDRGEVDFAKEFSVPFPSQVFLTLLGLPLDELDRFLTMKDGIIRPDHVTGKLLRLQGGAGLPAEDRGLGLRLLQRGPRPARGGATRRPAVDVPRRRDGGRPPDPQRHPGHLLPVPDRRARHGDGDARLHVRLPGPAPRAAAPAGRGPLADPERDRGDAALGDAGDGHRPGGRAGHRAGRLPGARGRPGHGHDRLGQHATRPSTPTATSCAGTATSTRTSRSVAASTAASARTWPAWSCGSPCASGTSGSPSTRSSRGTRSCTRRASAPSTTSRCGSPRPRPSRSQGAA